MLAFASGRSERDAVQEVDNHTSRRCAYEK
jgi:hypothetical protein